MLERLLNFIFSVVVNGILAIFVSIFMYVILAICIVLAMIPVSIIFEDSVAQGISKFLFQDLGFKVLYTLIFISMMLDAYGVPSTKTLYRWVVMKYREWRS